MLHYRDLDIQEYLKQLYRKYLVQKGVCLMECEKVHRIENHCFVKVCFVVVAWANSHTVNECQLFSSLWLWA
jgi:hypothetical protein